MEKEKGQHTAIDLKSITTAELCEELKSREGIEFFFVNPYEEKMLEIKGVASVFVVKD